MLLNHRHKQPCQPKTFGQTDKQQRGKKENNKEAGFGFLATVLLSQVHYCTETSLKHSLAMLSKLG